MRRLSFRAPALLGLSVQPGALHLVQLKKSRNSYFLHQAKYYELPLSIVSEGKIVDFRSLEEALTEIVIKEKLQAKQVAVNLSSNDVWMQRLRLPTGIQEDEVESEIKAHVQKKIAVNDEALAIDYHLFNQPETNQSEVFFAATQADYLKRFQRCLSASGMVLAIMELDLLSLRRAVFNALQFSLNHKDRVAIIYLSKYHGFIFGVQADDILFQQRCDFRASKAGLTEWLTEQCKALQAMQIGHVVLAGHEYHFSCVEMAKIIRDYWQGDIYEVDPFAQMSGTSVVRDINAGRSNYLMACGLAMREPLPWLN